MRNKDWEKERKKKKRQQWGNGGKEKEKEINRMQGDREIDGIKQKGQRKDAVRQGRREKEKKTWRGNGLQSTCGGWGGQHAPSHKVKNSPPYN